MAMEEATADTVGTSPSSPAGSAVTVEPLAELLGHTEPVWSLSWHPAGTLLASSSGDKCVRVWGPRADVPSTTGSSEVAGGAAAPPLPLPAAWETKSTLDGGHKRTVRCVSFAPAGNVMATASFDATIGIWDKDPNAAQNAELEYDYAATLEGHESEAKSVAWSSDGALLATCSRDKSVWIWEALEDNDFECLSVLQEHSQDVKMVKWHPSEEVLVSASYDDTLRVWRDDHDDWHCANILRGHTSTVWAVDFDRDGHYMATCSDDRSVRIWRYVSATDIKLVHTHAAAHARAVYSVAWHRGRRPWLATAGGDNAVHVWRWDAASGALTKVASLPASPHGACDVNCVAWNPGRPAGAADAEDVLATCGDDGAVRLWVVRENQESSAELMEVVES